MLHKINRLIMLFLLLSVVGCAAAGTEPAAVPTDDAAEQVAVEALPAARQALADYLGVDADSLEVETISDAEWGDSCLGLGGPAESCAAVVTPGYAISFMVDGADYTVRTDLDGSQARVEVPVSETPGGEAWPPAVAAARAELAGSLGIDPAAIELVDFTEQEWGDSCLGLGGPAESCAAVMTPGWLVVLMVEGQQYEVRTDLAGEQIRIADQVG